MLERISHAVRFRARSMFIWFVGPKIGETAQRQSAGGHESDKFSCHCLVCLFVCCLLFFSAIRAPFSWMDDRKRNIPVTNFLLKFSLADHQLDRWQSQTPRKSQGFNSQSS